ncbi:hydroxymethylglutaryl-CoA lyase [Mesorhizobium sp. BR1-1-2]|uniref:hydroxymethylglutaryl-CoA lyase n=1 Tax=Mesorhizobium sp. BR1-1-2 TaxID=2876652 RepID=UPI001CC99A68|nr:hydroxymethylglutaryl-CoA lyase [Mesorhizobium sp. BR1-1-2]MBZ9965875.1 hydroxymethylglutaryl-CoA lyase [Mesorhizobium sp. BR1-1-2]
MGEHVVVTEVGPRDGLQMAQSIMPTQAKIKWITAMAGAGISEIEVGSFVPATVVPQMADTAEIVAASLAIPALRVIALVPNLKGAQRAYESGAHAVVVPVSVSEAHSRANIRKGSRDQVDEVRQIVDWVRTQIRPMKVDAGCATAFGCSIDGNIPESRVLEIATALAEAGVDGIALADTVGYGNPAQVRSLVRAVRSAVGAKLERLHLHDTMGLGIANALAGLDEGIRCFDSALGGLGGCPFAPGASGNIVTEDLVFMLESMGFSTGIDLDGLLEARAYLRRGIPDEALLGNVALAGIPNTYRRAA